MLQDNIISLFVGIVPTIEKWLRDTVNDEVTKALEADHKKQRPNKQFSREEVCQLLNISKPTLWQKTKSGEIRAIKIGRRVLYDEAEVNRFIKQ